MLSREEFEKTMWKMSYEEYIKCYCPDCAIKHCIHRNAHRRVPKIDGGLGECPNLKEIDYKTYEVTYFGAITRKFKATSELQARVEAQKWVSKGGEYKDFYISYGDIEEIKEVEEE